MIEVSNLGKYYGGTAAVDDISFKVEQGEILGFLGPNGAGKTTTMRILTCFMAPSRGTARTVALLRTIFRFSVLGTKPAGSGLNTIAGATELSIGIARSCAIDWRWLRRPRAMAVRSSSLN